LQRRTPALGHDALQVGVIFDGWHSVAVRAERKRIMVAAGACPEVRATSPVRSRQNKYWHTLTSGKAEDELAAWPRDALTSLHGLTRCEPFPTLGLPQGPSEQTRSGAGPRFAPPMPGAHD
jgi:hypothetical protein